MQKNEARLNFFISFLLSILELHTMSEWKDELNNESDDLKDLEPVTDSKPSATTEEANETTEDPTEVDKVDTHTQHTQDVACRTHAITTML